VSDPSLFALDVAILLPPDVSKRAIELSAALPGRESQGLRLGNDMLPHVTLTQQFVRNADLDIALQQVASVLTEIGPLRLAVTGAGREQSSVWMAIERTPALFELHCNLMDILNPFERPNGTASAFWDGNARAGDVVWVADFRRESSHAAFRPHITLGHSVTLPPVEPLNFTATTIAACHLGRFCTCRRVLRQWEFKSPRPRA
jgi:2'-5' RNA ligase